MGVAIRYLDIEQSIKFKSVIGKLIEELILEENYQLGEINLVFTGNAQILEINKSYLNHHYYTDVITFPGTKKSRISGDIYISLEQVKINAKRYKTIFHDEATRVIIHGILHLLGYDDITPEQKVLMSKKEDHYLCRFKKIDFVQNEGEI